MIKTRAVNKYLIYNHLKLHFVVFIYGFTAILGKLIESSALILVWYRVLIAALAFVVILQWNKISWKVPIGQALSLLGVGLIVGAHWVTFFGAIKLSNVSVTLGCLASTTLFTSLFEPLYLKKRLNLFELIIGLFIILGLYLIFQFEMHYWKGIVFAIITSILAGWFTVLNKKLITRHRARIISFYEMLGAFLGISIYLAISGDLFSSSIIPGKNDFIYLLILGIVCTAYAFTVQVDVMKELSAFIVALTINLEPIYGILLAFIFFGEHELLSNGFYFGTGIILASVFGYPLIKYYSRKFTGI